MWGQSIENKHNCNPVRSIPIEVVREISRLPGGREWWDSGKKWHPPPAHREMVDMIKNKVETKGFQQVISGHTRSWRGQTESCIDHVWTDKPECIISTRNVLRAYSDHNLICANIRLKGMEQPNHILIRRNKKKNM